MMHFDELLSYVPVEFLEVETAGHTVKAMKAYRIVSQLRVTFSAS